MRTIKKIYIFSLFFTLISIFILDYLSILNPIFGKLGVVFWIIQFLFILIYSLKSLIFIFRQKSYLILLMISILFGVVLLNTNNLKNISGETTQEISCTLNLLNSSPDWGFRKTCLFGYPARQLFLPSLPSLVLGTNQFSLNLGECLYFFLGSIIY